MKHTPGPWRHDYYGRYDDFIRDGEGNVIAHIGANRSNVEENTANARLIAAAPQMYEALRAMIAHRQHDYLDNEIEPYAACVAAIEKAEGN